MNKKRTSKEINYITQGSVGSLAAIVCCLLGFIRMILFQNKVGDEGIANYAYAFELYQILYIVAALAISKTVAKMTTVRQSRDQHKNKRKVFQYGLFRVILFSLILGGILIFASDWIASTLLAQNNISLTLKCLGVSLIPAGVLAVCNGYLRGMGYSVPVHLSQMLEQLMNLIFTLCFAGVLFRYGNRVSALLCDSAKENAFGAAAGGIGVFFGALFSMLFVLFVLFLLRHNLHKQYIGDTGKTVERYQKLAASTETMSAFVMLSLLMNTAAVFVNQILYFHQVADGKSGVRAVSYYGAYYGKVRLFIFTPLVLSMIMETVLTPQLKRIFKKDDVTHLKQRMEQSLKELMVLLIPIAVYIGVLAEPLFNLLFKGQIKIAVTMMKPAAVCIVLFGILSITSSALMGMGKSKILYVSQAVAFFVQVLSFAIFFINLKTPVMGLIYAMLLGVTCQIGVQAGYLINKLHYKPDFISIFAIPTVLAAVTGLINYLINHFAGDLLGEWITLLICLVLTCILYMLGILFTKILKVHELLELPFGSCWLKLGKILGIF